MLGFIMVQKSIDPNLIVLGTVTYREQIILKSEIHRVFVTLIIFIIESIFQTVDMMEFFTKASKEIPTFKGMKAPFDTALKVQPLLTGDQNIFIAGTVSITYLYLIELYFEQHITFYPT